MVVFKIVEKVVILLEEVFCELLYCMIGMICDMLNEVYDWFGK